MERFYIYHGCLALVGAAFGSTALLRLVGGEMNIPLVVQATFGALMAGVSVRELRTKTPADFEVGPVGFWGVVLGSIGLVALALL